MVKLRNAYYCNLKLFLIWLVIFGHLIEPDIGTSPGLYELYRLIYLFHMPLFVFLSGLFLRDSQGCIRQLRRMLPIYLICQIIAVALGQTRWHTPWWILWYLLSLCCWLGISALLLRMLIAPVICWLLMKQLPDSTFVLQIFAVIFALPAAASTTMFCARFEKDGTVAALCVLLSTILCAILLPLYCTLLII